MSAEQSLDSLAKLLDGETKDFAAFIRAATIATPLPLTPEIHMCLAAEATPLWLATEAFLETTGLPPPYWAFAWPGGQATARYILDHPETFRGRTVVDAAAGGGVTALAAARVGAARVAAFDIDPFALTAIAINAALNGVTIEGRLGDALDPRWLKELPADAVIVAGDVCYEQPMADRFHAWLRARAAEGRMVITGDPGRAYSRSIGLEPLACYAVPTSRAVEASDVMQTGVWRWSATMNETE